jgi:hypothetical protein
MNSKLESVFNISIVGGALGLAFADSISEGSSGLFGFVIGVLGTFAFFSILATISDSGKFRTETEFEATTDLINKLLEATIVKIQQQRTLFEEPPQQRNTNTLT